MGSLCFGHRHSFRDCKLGTEGLYMRLSFPGGTKRQQRDLLLEKRMLKRSYGSFRNLDFVEEIEEETRW